MITHIVPLPIEINVSFLHIIKGEQPLFVPQLLLKHILPAVTSWSRTVLHQNQQGDGPGAVCSHLALQSVGVLGTAQPHVVGQSRVLVQQLPVLLLPHQRLGSPGMHQGYHVQWQVEVRLCVLKTSLIFHLSNEKQITWVTQQSN